jgi:hypothetical protein
MSAGPAPAPSAVEATLVTQPDEDAELLRPEHEIVGSTFWDFLQTQPGGTIANKLLDIIQSLQKSTIEANAEQNKQQIANNAVQQKQSIEFQHKTYRFSLYLQGSIFASCILATAVLAWHDKLTGTATTVICTTLGYLFGRSGQAAR